ncbi:MAG: VOC family protein [Chloroflexota bacterium]
MLRRSVSQTAVLSLTHLRTQGEIQMQVVSQYPDGLFCWVDLGSTDVDAAKAFYCGLFGWTILDLPTDMGGIYTMFQIDGYNVTAVSALPPEMQAQGIPTAWTNYIKHDNVDAAVEKITEAGGTIIAPPFDVMTSGRMAIALDPGGAGFGIWQPQDHIGAQLVNIPNTLVWNELQTRAGDTSKAFYKTVFGWESQTDPNGYVTFTQNGRFHAGMIIMDDSWDPNMPNQWGPYFMVEDVAATMEKAKTLGGNVFVPPTPAGDMGLFSVLQDPSGGVFTVIQFSGPVDAPPGY